MKKLRGFSYAAIFLRGGSCLADCGMMIPIFLYREFLPTVRRGFLNAT